MIAVSQNTYKCRLCGSEEYFLLLTECKSSLGETYCLRKCKKCSFTTTYPIPAEETLKRCYNNGYWLSSKESASFLFKLLFFFRMRGILVELKRLIPKGGCVLDWGAGDGTWIRLIRRNGFEGWGFDQYAKIPNDKFLKQGTIETIKFPEHFFDAITCFHVLEHLANPIDSVKKAMEMLKKGGIMIIEVPNIASLGFEIFKEKWQPLEIPTHLNHFSVESLQKLFSIINNSEIIKVGFFSHRVSPSALALSLFPFFSPKKIRRVYGNKYPFFLMAIYLCIQLLLYPFAITESFLKRGEVIRLYIRKTDK